MRLCSNIKSEKGTQGYIQLDNHKNLKITFIKIMHINIQIYLNIKH